MPRFAGRPIPPHAKRQGLPRAGFGEIFQKTAREKKECATIRTEELFDDIEASVPDDVAI